MGIVVHNDGEKKQLQIRELDSDTVTTLAYGASSVITDKYKEEREGDQIEEGMILKADYRSDDGWIVSAGVPDDVWEYQDVKKFSFASDENMMQVAGEKYQYSSMTYFASGKESVEPIEFNNQDVLTVRGIGFRVYSAVRTAGHGYIRLTNYDDFVGGMAEISSAMMVPISDNMLITVAEGTYRVTLCKRRASATKTATVRSDEETVVDFSDYVAKAENIGEVTFNIEPEGAEMYLNGTAVNYSKPIALRYGKYNIVVSLTGYETYSGVLEVAQPTVANPITINLIERKAETATSSPAKKPTPSPSSSNTDKVTKKIDSNHTITVSAPEGVEVYLDNVYKGLAPCTFTKVIGSQTITLSDEGYVTKSYSVDILDDDKNAKFSFAELVKEEEEE
jgi:PEGA domain.